MPGKSGYHLPGWPVDDYRCDENEGAEDDYFDRDHVRAAVSDSEPQVDRGHDRQPNRATDSGEQWGS